MHRIPAFSANTASAATKTVLAAAIAALLARRRQAAAGQSPPRAPGLGGLPRDPRACACTGPRSSPSSHTCARAARQPLRAARTRESGPSRLRCCFPPLRDRPTQSTNPPD